jgi:hypothetical protein
MTKTKEIKETEAVETAKFRQLEATEFWHLPNMAKADLGREVQRKHREAGIRMAPKDARRYARMLMKEGHALVSGEHVRGKQVKATRTNKTNFKPETVAYKIGDY